MAGVALGDMDHHLALMALGWLWWRAWAGVDGRGGPAALCVAGVALLRHPPYFHVLVTWNVTLRGRRGAYGIGLAPVARLGRSGRGGRRGFLRGRRGTW